MTRALYSLTVLLGLLCFWPSSLLGVEISIENPLDSEERVEMQRFANSLPPHATQKAISDLGRYESVQCEGGTPPTLCKLKRFPMVGTVRFVGIPLLILESELRKHVPIKAGQIIHPGEKEFDDLLARATNSLRAYLERKGYFFSQIQTSLKPVEDLPISELIFTVREGSFYRVRNVTIDGELPFDKKIITKPFKQMCANVRFSFESVFEGTKACYDKDIEAETIADVEDKLADMGYVEAHVSVQKDFGLRNPNDPKVLDLKINVRLGPKLITSFVFVNAQVLTLSPFVAFLRKISGIELFSRMLNTNASEGRYPEDETILTRELEDALTFKKTHSIDETQINASVDGLLEVLRARGYLNAAIEVKRQSSRNKWMKIEFLVTPGQPSALSQIQIVGSPSFDYDDFRELPFLIRTRAAFSSGHFTNFALDNDVALLLSAFKQKGYDAAHVTPITEMGTESASLLYLVEPGERKIIAQIIFNSDDPQVTAHFLRENRLCDGQEIEELRQEDSTVVTCKGDPFVEGEVENSRLILTDLYHNFGYVTAEVKAETKLNDNAVSITFDILPKDKKRARIAGFLTDGNVITRRSAIERELGSSTVATGNYLNPLALDEGLTRLRRYNIFSKIALENIKKPDSDEEYYLSLQVAEKPTFNIDMTLAFNTDRLFDLGLLMNERNLFGGLLQLKSDFHFGLFIGRLTTFRNSLTWPRFYGAPMDIEFSFPYLLYEAVPTPPVLQRHAHFESSVRFEWQFLKRLFPSLKFEFRADKWQTDVIAEANLKTTFENLDGLSLVLREPSSLRGILKPALSAIWLDDLFDPHNGLKLSGGLDISGTTFGAAIPFNVFNFQGSGYKTFGPFTFALNLQLKRGIIPDAANNWWILQFQSDFETLGGIKGPRAYDQGTIGIYGVLRDNRQGNFVLDSNGNPVSGYHPGNLSLQSTAEIRFPLIERLLFGKLNGALFTDLAFVGICETSFICFDRDPTLDPQGQNRQLGMAVGIGLRYLLPVGPISVDYGLSPVHEGTGLFGRASRLNFQFGYPF